MAKGACKCKPTECEECPEWIFTFADLVMLMMGFFVILWVTKPGGAPTVGGPSDSNGKQQYAKMIIEIRKAFGYIPDGNGDDIYKEATGLPTVGSVDRPFQSAGAGGETKEPRQSPQGTDALVTNVRPGTHVSVGGKLLFDLGESRLTPETTRTLDEIAQIIKGHYNLVIVKGHASLDDIPEQTGSSDRARSQQQMDLSLRRAQAAASYLISKSILPSVVRVQGCSTYEPLVQKVYTAQAQALNRRVEVEETDQLVRELQDPSAPTTVPALSPSSDRPGSPGK